MGVFNPLTSGIGLQSSQAAQLTPFGFAAGFVNGVGPGTLQIGSNGISSSLAGPMANMNVINNLGAATPFAPAIGLFGNPLGPNTVPALPGFNMASLFPQAGLVNPMAVNPAASPFLNSGFGSAGLPVQFGGVTPVPGFSPTGTFLPQASIPVGAFPQSGFGVPNSLSGLNSGALTLGGASAFGASPLGASSLASLMPGVPSQLGTAALSQNWNAWASSWIQQYMQQASQFFSQSLGNVFGGFPTGLSGSGLGGNAGGLSPAFATAGGSVNPFGAAGMPAGLTSSTFGASPLGLGAAGMTTGLNPFATSMVGGVSGIAGAAGFSPVPGAMGQLSQLPDGSPVILVPVISTAGSTLGTGFGGSVFPTQTGFPTGIGGSNGLAPLSTALGGVGGQPLAFPGANGLPLGTQFIPTSQLSGIGSQQQLAQILANTPGAFGQNSQLQQLQLQQMQQAQLMQQMQMQQMQGMQGMSALQIPPQLLNHPVVQQFLAAKNSTGMGGILVSPLGTYITSIGPQGGTANAGLLGTQSSGSGIAMVLSPLNPGMIISISSAEYARTNFNRGFFSA